MFACIAFAAPAVADQAPATPSSVSVTRGDGTLHATWPAVENATSYHITYSSDSGASWSLAALNHPDADITISGVDNASTYLVGVRARNKHGDSGWRNSPSVGPLTAPAAPTGLTATAGDASVTLAWDDPSDASLTGYEYNVNHNATSTGNLSGWSDWTAIPGSDGSSTSHTFTDLTNGREYRYHVRAVNAVGPGPGAPDAHPWFVSATPDEPSVAPSSVALTVAPWSIAENADPTSVTVTATADAAVAANTAVTVSIGGGTATSGTDYEAVADFEVEIPAGGTTGTGAFKLTPIDDTEGEDDETITVSGSASGLTVNGTSLTLTDYEEASAEWWYGAKLSVAPGSVSENGGSQKVTVTAEVSEWGTSSSDLTYTVSVGKGGDSAVSGTDYHAVAKFDVVIKANRRSGSNSFNLEPIGDTDWEGDETITVHAEGTGGAQSTALTLTDEGDRPYGGPQVTLSANPSTLSEADGATTVTVTAASSAHSTARTVTVSVGGSGTATSGTDYAAVSDFTISLAKNATSATGTFTLTPTQDVLAEGDETIAIAGNVEGSSAKLTGTNLTLTDDDAAPAIFLSASPASVTENGGAKTVTVTATATTAAAKARTILVAVGNRQDTATAGTDYTVVPAFNITIAANATTATGSFSLTPTNDTSVEDAESISIDGTPESAGASFNVGGTAITLTDDDAQPAVTLTATPSSVAEAALATSVTVKATAASTVAWARTVTISVGKTGSAASGTDYAAVSNFDIEIAANATKGTGTFTLAPIQDTTNEGNETIGVAGTSLNTTVTGATVTLADDDINPAVTLSVSPASVSESASATSVTVTATGASAMSSARTVAVKVGGGTATSGTDYAAVSDFNITIAASATSGTGTFTLTPTQDTTVEGGETIGVSGSSTGTTVTGTTVALTDDDALPAVTLSTSTSSVAESASATSVTVTATAASSHSSARTVTVSVGQTGTASSASDYAAVTDFDITIAANATSGTGSFTLTPIQDTLVEHNETIGVDGSSPRTVMTNATITLTDDDKDAVTLSLNRRTLGEEASGTSVTVTATAATAIAVARTVSVSVGDTGTATSGTDYSAVSDFDITIAANATSGTGSFTLTPTQDTTNEGNETIGIAGTNSLSTVTGTTLTLVDDDQPTISLSAGTAAFSESWSGTIDVTATRSGSTTSAVDVTIIVGRDTDSATEGVDYTEVADYTITIPAGQTSASKGFSVAGKRDFVADNNERFSIGGLATGYKVNDVSNGVGIFEWYATIGLTTDVSSVSEHDGATTVTTTAHIHPTVYGNVYVTVSVGGGSATSGTDYAAVSNFTITIPNKASSATGTFTLTPTQDALLESDETININGSGSHWNFYAGQATSMTLTDAQPISLSAQPSSISEGAAATQVAVTATATGTVATPRTLTVSVGDTGTATSGTDYAAVSDFDITIPANKTGATNTFTLAPTKDSAAEGDETIGVAGSSTGAYVYPTTLTLADTDPAVTLSAAPSSISEAAGATSVTVTATAAEAVGSVRTVTVSVGGSGTATSGTDYAAVSDFTITIAANATSGSGSFTLTPTDDTALEGDETIDVTGTSSEAATISRAVLTLTDDDLPTITLATVPAYVAVAEGAGLTSVTVRATAAAAMKAETTVTLAIGAGGDSATKTTDYTTSNVRTITIPAGQSTAEASFELTPEQDTAVEGNESVSISGSSSGGHAVTGTSLVLTDDDKHAITLSASPSSVGEGASATSVTVTATAKASTSSARTVRVQVGDSGTATSGTDYAAVSDFTITIAANAKTGTGTFTLTPTQDTSVEGNETIGVEGASPNSTVTGTTMTLTDDDSYPAITLSANPSSVSEGASGTSVTVTATAASAIASARTVTVSVGGSGTASSGTDYSTVADFTITIAANATSGTGTFTLTPTQDTAVEGSETIGVAGSSPSSTVTGTTVTLTDDDTHAITLSASPSSVSESKSSETVTVTATINAARTSATTVTVSVGESGDEATSGTDYEAVSDFTVTIAANKTSGTGTFTFKPKTDTAYEGFESVTISGTTGGGGGANANSSNTSIPVTNTSLSIHDSSNYPAVTLSAAPSSVGEGDGATSVTVTATAASAIASSREVTVSVGGSGTAVSGTDYTAVSDFVVKIAANATTGTATFTLTPTDDSVVEASETIGVAGTSLSTTVTGTTLTLTDNDSAEVTVNDANAAEGSDMTFTVTLDTAVDGGLTVTPDFTDVTATEGTDYDENTAALSFTGTAGETQTFTVSATQDDVVEGDETFTVGLTASNAPTGVTVTATDTGTGTINSGTGGDQDTSTLTINDASASEGDSMTFTVTLSEAVQGGLTVTPSYTNGTAASGDYTANTTALSFTGTKGETKTFTVSTTEDAVLEANETLTVGMTVSGTTLTGSITATDTGTGTINNDDSSTVTVNDASASEGNSMTFTVTLSEAVQGGLTVTPDFTDVTATEGTDYDENTADLDFSGTKGETKTFTVSTDEDAVLEANETFTVGLSVSDAPTGVTVTDTGTGTINNDDSAAVTVNDANADEGDGMTFTVTLSEAVQGGLKVTPSYTNGTTASGDYTANTTALTFTGTKGETKTFTVSTTEDAVLEANETFTVGLTVSDAPTGTTVTATDTGTGTINNDDGATVTVNDANADEGDAITFTVTLGAAVQGGLKVTPGYTNGTAANGDYSKNTTALTFTGTANETKTFTVSTTEDAVLEADETFTVDLTVSGTSLSITATDTGTGTINNDDSAAVTVNDANADEGNSMTFTVTLGAAVQGGLKVTPGFTDGTAVEGTDYDENTTALTFTGTKGETETFTVSTTEDAVVEGNETFTVGLSVSGTSLSIAATDTGAGTINNDDGAVVTVNNASASEGDDITFTVTLGAAVQGGLTVTPSFTDVTAAEGTDYDENTTALSFAGTKGETETFTVSTTEDAVLEANETFTVGLSASNSSVTATDTGTGTINNDDSAALTVNDASADEGDAMTFTVTLDKAVQGGLKVTPTYSNGTASGTDYTKNTTALTFTGTANETKTFTVSTKEDAVLEADETFTVGLTVSGTSLGVGASDTGAGTIDNDDSSAVTINDANAAEGNSIAFTVTLAEAVQGGLDVTAGYTNGTAASTDYTANTKALSFNGTKGETRTLSVRTTEDYLFEGNETFTVGLTVSGTALVVTATDTGTGTIDNDDSEPSVNLALNRSSVGEGASGSSLTVTARFSNSTVYETDQTATVSVGGSGTATAGRDFAAVTDFDVTIATGQSSGTATFTLTPTQDTLIEGDETIGVAGSVAGLTVNGTTLTLGDDDAVPAVNLSLSPSSVGEGDSPTAVTVTAAFSNASTFRADRTVTVAVGGSGTATPGADYSVHADFDIVVKAGRTSGTGIFTLVPLYDSVVEGSETVGVAGTSSGLTVNGAVLTLTDDEPDPVVNLSLAPAKVAEDAGATTVAVTAAFADGFTYGADTAVAVSVGGTGTSVSGTDYAAVRDFDVTIPANAASATGYFVLTPIQDALAEGDETVGVAGSAAGTRVNGTTLTLTDDEATLTIADARAEEGEDLTFTVTVDNAVPGGFTVTPAYTDGTADGTDYTRNAAALRFAGTVGETKTFTVSTTEDTVVEGDETFTVGLTVSGAARAVAAADTGTGTINDDDSVPEVNLSLNPSSAAESAGATSVTVTAELSDGGTYAGDTTVTVSVGGSGTATAGTDYAAVPEFAITIPANAASGTAEFILTPIQDALAEGDETVGVAGTADGLTVNGAVLTLTDDDAAPAVNLSLAPAKVAEGDGATTVTVTAELSGRGTYAADTTVTVSVGGSGTATAGTDYAAVPDFAITIEANAASGTADFSLTPTQDALVEGDETIGVAGSASGLTVNGATLTLTDDDAATLAISDASAAEGEDLTFTLTLDKAVPGGFTVTPAYTDGTAVDDDDYTSNAAALDFNGTADETRTFTVSTTQDTLVEGDETFTVGLTVSGTTRPVAAADTGTGTIDDDDTAPAVILSLNPVSVGEGDGATAVTVTAAFSNASTYAADTTVAVSVGGTGTATTGTDYAAVPEFDITIEANAASATGTFTLTPSQDALVEGDETVGVAGTTDGLTVNGAVLTLTDDDAAPAVNLSLNPASVAENAGATSVTVTAAFSNASTYAADTTVTVSVGGTGTATAGTDYAAVPDFAITIPANAASGTAEFTLTPSQDALVEGDETVGVAGTADGLTVNGAVLALTDDDAVPAVNLSLSPASVGEGDGATSVTVTAAFSNASTYAADTTVTVSVGGTGTATTGTDYAAASDFAITIEAGGASGTGTFTLTPVQDALVEGDETIGVAGSASGLTVNGAMLTLVEDDTATLTISDASAAEGEDLTFTVSVDKAVPGGFTVTPGYTDGAAVAGDDYTSNAAALDFNGTADETRTLTVSTTQDTLVEGDETFTVGLTVSGTPHTLAAADTGTGTIDDDDTAPAVILSLNPVSMGEGDGATAVTVTAAFSNTSTYADDRTVAVSVGGSGTATAGTDYAAVSDFAITIEAGGASGTSTFTLTPTQDTLVEGDETVAVAGAAGGLTVHGAVLALTDDDAAPAVNLSLSPASVVENAGATTVTVTAAFSNASTYADDRTVAVSVGGSGTAAAGTDYAAVPDFGLTIPANGASATGTFTLTPIQDALVEDDEAIGVAGSATGLTVNGAALTLTDDDTATLMISDARAEEGEGLTFTVSVDKAVPGGFTVTPSYTDGTAVAGDDYTPNTAALGFRGAVNERHSFTVSTTEDTEVEPDETFSLNLSVAAHGGTNSHGVAGARDARSKIAYASVTGTIENDDVYKIVVKARVVLAADPDTVGEDADPVTVELTAAADSAIASARTVRIAVGDAADSAQEGTDYAAVGDLDLVIAAHAAAGTARFTLAPNDDDIIEGDETITVAGSGEDMDVQDATITLTDDETAPAVNLSLDPASVGEGDGATAVTVTAAFSGSGVYAADTAVTVSVGGTGTATADTDYSAVGDIEVTVPAGRTSGTGTFTLTPTQDGLVEGAETIGVAGAATGLTVNGAELTLADDDRATLTVADARADEGARMTFTVTLDKAVPGGLTATPDYANGTADETDYAGDTNTLRFSGAAAETKTFQVSTIDDALREGDETFAVALSVSGTPHRVAADTATGTIVDDDSATADRLMTVHEPILADVSLAMTESVVDTVSGRMEQASHGPARRFDYAGGGGHGGETLFPGVSGLSPHGAAGAPWPNGGHGTMAHPGAPGLSPYAPGMHHAGVFGATAALGGPGAGERGMLPLGGHAGAGHYRPSMRDRLGALSFEYSLRDPEDAAAGPGTTVWGRGDVRTLGGGHDYAGPGESVAWDGDVLGVVVGADRFVRPGLLAGVAVSRFDSAMDYEAREPGGRFEGVYETSMTSVHPYANWAATPKLDIWAAVGYGEGEILFDEEEFGVQKADSGWRTGAAGGKLLLAALEGLVPGGTTRLNLKADAFATRLDIRDNGELVRPLGVRANRLRLAVVGEHERVLASGAVFTPALEVGGRRDGGAGETGAGLEVGGRLRYASAGGRLSVELRAHTLAAFDGDKREWGVGGAALLTSDPQGRGLSFSLRPSYGAAGAGTQGMWQQRPVQDFASPLAARLDSEFGYGVALGRGGLLTLLTGVSWQEQGPMRQTAGALLERGGLRLRLGLERVATPQGAEYGVMLQLQKLLGYRPTSAAPAP